MREDLIFQTIDPSKPFSKALEDTLREGARRLLQQAIENEVQEFIDAYIDSRTKDGRQSVVRNGYLPERMVQTGIGAVSVKQPCIRDREKKRAFTSAILPPYLRRTPSVEAVVSALYLRGISTNNFAEALEALFGENAKGLSPTNIVRLKDGWEAEYTEMWIAPSNLDDGFQAGNISTKALEKTSWARTYRESDQRSPIQRWGRSEDAGEGCVNLFWIEGVLMIPVHNF